MNIAIIQCDSVINELKTGFGDYPDMIKHMFESVDVDLQFRVFNVQKDEYPQNINDFDFYITTGSKAGIYDNAAWIKSLISYIRVLDAKKKKLIGICFGHQAIAMARHGLVEKSPKGWGIGVATNHIVAQPAWMKTPEGELNIIVSHQDQITHLPEDTRLIASSGFCPYFVVQWGDHFLSIQGHPEWQRDYSRAVMALRRETLGEERYAAGLASLVIAPDNKLFAHWILDFVTHQAGA